MREDIVCISKPPEPDRAKPPATHSSHGVWDETVRVRLAQILTIIVVVALLSLILLPMWCLAEHWIEQKCQQFPGHFLWQEPKDW